MTSSATVAVHKSSMASSLELPINNGGESSAVKVGARKCAINLIHTLAQCFLKNICRFI